MMYWNAWSGRPPLQPWLPSAAVHVCKGHMQYTHLVLHVGGVSIRITWAVDQILFRQGYQFASSIEVLSL